MTDAELTARLSKPRFPRASNYDGRWIVDNLMGPHVLWLAEYLGEALELKPGSRLLDLGCGKAISSIFFAREYGVQVIAADLWIKPDENARRIEQAGMAERVIPIHAEARALPFAQNYFDAIVSLDAYHYFGTDDFYLGNIVKFLKPGGRLGMVCPGVREECETWPDALKPYFEPDFGSFHSPHWWRHHWDKTGLVEIETADWMADGHALWLEWLKLTRDFGWKAKGGAAREIEMLEKDRDRLFGFSRLVAKRASTSPA